jgi:hypothetical protein
MDITRIDQASTLSDWYALKYSNGTSKGSIPLLISVGLCRYFYHPHKMIMLPSQTLANSWHTCIFITEKLYAAKIHFLL